MSEEMRRDSIASDRSAGSARSVGSLLFLFLALALPTLLPAAEAPSAQAQQLDRSIAETISKPEYSWREPRKLITTAKNLPSAEMSMLDKFFENIANTLQKYAKALSGWMERLEKWLKKKFGNRKPPSFNLGQPDWPAWKRAALLIFYITAAVAAAILGVYLYRLYKSSNPLRPPTATAIPTLLELPDDGLAAAHLPDDEWLKMARDFLAKGELRPAIRAMFLASLSRLARTEQLSLARHKSNRDYTKELQRRSHDMPGIIKAFAENVAVVEMIWYGNYSAANDDVNLFKDNLEVIFNEKIIV